MSFEWDEKFRIGENAIDHQHQVLIRLANEFLAATGRPALERCVQQLLEYTRNHFEYEEILMRRFNYAEYEAHAQAHAELLARLEKLSHRISNDSLDKMELELFLRYMTVIHIPQVDSKLAEFLGSDETIRGSI